MPANKRLQLPLPNDYYDETEADKQRAVAEQALGLLSPDNPLLQENTQPIAPEDITSGGVQQVISRLYDTALGQRKDSAQHAKRTLVGLAAPQIGELWRIVLVDTKAQANRKGVSRPECFINPEIIWRSHETEEGREGCFSAGSVWGLVRRPVAVKIAALTPEGKPVERILEGFAARIMQHEIDHLDGIRFPDRIKADRKRHWVHAEELDIYPKRIRHWPRVCTKGRWRQLTQR